MRSTRSKLSVRPLIGIVYEAEWNGLCSRSSAKVAIRSVSGWLQKPGSAMGDGAMSVMGRHHTLGYVQPAAGTVAR